MELAVANSMLVLGVVLIVKGGDAFVDAAVRMAEVFGVSKFIASVVVK